MSTSHEAGTESYSLAPTPLPNKRIKYELSWVLDMLQFVWLVLRLIDRRHLSGGFDDRFEGRDLATLLICESSPFVLAVMFFVSVYGHFVSHLCSCVLRVLPFDRGSRAFAGS